MEIYDGFLKLSGAEGGQKLTRCRSGFTHGTMPLTADDLRTLAKSPMSVARRFVDQHKDEVVRAARMGVFSAEFEYVGGPRQTLESILKLFREEFPGVEAYPCSRKGVPGVRVVVSWKDDSEDDS